MQFLLGLELALVYGLWSSVQVNLGNGGSHDRVVETQNQIRFMQDISKDLVGKLYMNQSKEKVMDGSSKVSLST